MSNIRQQCLWFTVRYETFCYSCLQYLKHTTDSCYWHSVCLLCHPHKEGLELVFVFMRDIMQENENVSWQSCPKIPNSKWQHPYWLACFSIKLGYTSDEERWPTSILMTCFTCVWANECVWEGEMDGERKWEKHWEKERTCLFLAVPGPCSFQKAHSENRHCIVL